VPGQSAVFRSHCNEVSLSLSASSPKGADLGNFTKYLKTVLEQYDTLWNEYLKPRWAHQRMRLYGGKKRVFAKFFKGLVSKGKKTVVVWRCKGNNNSRLPTSMILLRETFNNILFKAGAPVSISLIELV
jgi:hypothetical protein